jgi:hypothetical protein
LRIFVENPPATEKVRSLQVDVGWIVSSAKKSLSRFGDLVPLFSKKFECCLNQWKLSSRIFIGPLSMTDAIELCSSVAKSIFSVDVELDSLVVFPTVAMTGIVSADWVDVLNGAKSDEKFLFKIFLAVLMIAVFDELTYFIIFFRTRKCEILKISH